MLQRSTATLGPDHPSSLAALRDLAQTLHSLGDLEGAKHRMEQVLERCTVTLGPEHPETLIAMHNLAFTLRDLGQSEGPSVLLHQVVNALAIRAGELRDATPLDVASLGNLALLQHEAGNLDHAGELLIATLDALENVSDRFDVTERLRSSLLANRRIIYHKALTVALERGRADEAFRVLERYRARSLLNLLRWGQDVLPVSEIANGLRDVGRRLDAGRRELQDLEADSDSATRLALNSELVELQRRREVLLGRYVRDAEGKSRRDVLNAEDVIRGLEPGTVLLAFSINREGLNLFVLRRDHPLGRFALDGTEEGLTQKVTEFLALLRPFGPEELLTGSATGRDQALADAARWLHEKLLAPAEGLIDDAKRLLILPDGPLHYLPFAALVRSAKEDPRGWQYLVEWKPIHVAQSATVDAVLRARRQDSASPAQAPRSFVAFAHPTRSETAATIAESTGPSRDAMAERGPVPVALRSALDRNRADGLTTLHHAGREVRSVRELFESRAVPTQVFVDVEATEEIAKRDLASARYIHFAVHGFIDPEYADDSFLALRVPEGLPKDRDNGLLQAWEIIDQLHLDADLVTLSACSTASGPTLGGEGLMSLARAFQIAGARSVLASQWRVDDASTAELMIRFYDHHLAGLPKDQALRAAQMELIAGPIPVPNDKGQMEMRNFSAPHYWAGFQLIGDWQ